MSISATVLSLCPGLRKCRSFCWVGGGPLFKTKATHEVDQILHWQNQQLGWKFLFFAFWCMRIPESPRMPRMAALIFFQTLILRLTLLPSNYFLTLQWKSDKHQSLSRNCNSRQCDLLCGAPCCGGVSGPRVVCTADIPSDTSRLGMYVVCTSAWYKQIVCTKHQPLCAMHSSDTSR